MPTPILGREMVVIYDSSVVGFATDFTWGGDKDFVEITTLSSGGNKEFLPVSKSYAFDFNGLVSKTSGDSSRGYNYIMSNFINSDASVVAGIKLEVSGNTYYEMTAYLKSVKAQGDKDGLVTFSGSVQPTGAVRIKTA